MSAGSLTHDSLTLLVPRFGPARWSDAVAAMTVSAYFTALVLPLRTDFGSAALGVGALLTILTTGRVSQGRVFRLLDGALVVFLLASGLSIATSMDPARSLRLSAAFLPALLLFVIIARHLARPEGVRLLAQILSTAVLVVGGMLAHAAWAGTVGGPAALVAATGSPLLLVPNDAVLLALIAPLSLSLVLSRGGRAACILGILSLAVTGTVLVVLQSRIGVLTMAGGLIAVIVLCRSRRGLIVLTGLAALALAADASQGFALVGKFGQMLDPRVALWITGLAMWMDAPLLGHGPRSFGLLYAEYRDALSLPAWLPIDDRIVPWAHSLWVEALAEQGLVGFGALLVLMACGLRAAWRSFRRSSGEARTLRAGVLAALVVFCGAATVELTFVRQWVVVVLCTLLGMSAPRKESP